MYESHDRDVLSTSCRGVRRAGYAGLVVGDGQTWVVLSRGRLEPEDPEEPPPEAGTMPVRMCRAILDDDTVILGEVDPERAVLLAEILGRG